MSTAVEKNFQIIFQCIFFRMLEVFALLRLGESGIILKILKGVFLVIVYRCALWENVYAAMFLNYKI